jgi:hypothetical protein
MKNLVLTNNKVATIKKNLIEGMTIASGAKSSATYYHSKEEQTQAIKNNVKKLYKLSKELPLIVASQKGVTGKFISEVLLNEFKNTQSGGACNIVNPIDWYDEGIGDKALLSALYNLNENGITYVLRLFVEMKNEKVNNERARKIILGFLLGHPNLEFYALKYRNKISEVLQHVYGVKKTSVLLSIAKKFIQSGVYDGDKEVNIVNDCILKYTNIDDVKIFKLFLFIFKEDNNIRYLKRDFPIIFEYQKAKTDITNVNKVPEEILIGLISNKNHPQYEELWSTELKRKTTKAMLRKNTEVTSVNQQVRQTKSTAKLGVEKNVDVKKATDFLALYKTGYENGWTSELKNAIDELAEKKKIANFYYKNIGIILDNSNSMTGHKQQSKNTPKAIANFTARVLSKSAESNTIAKVNDDVTDLATAFVELLKKENSEKPYDAVFILTDGYENSYEGLMNEVVNAYFMESNKNIPVFQISPITGAEMGGNVRNLGENVVTMSINDPVAIQPQINARLLEIDTTRWLKNQIQAIEQTNVTRKVNKNINV